MPETLGPDISQIGIKPREDEKDEDDITEVAAEMRTMPGGEILPHVQTLWPAATTLVGDPGTIKGVVTDLLPDFAGRADQIFACGPLPMYRAMARMPSLKNKSVQVSLEVVMGCGRGVCYGCTIRTRSGLKKVCEDGPVFDMDDILWEELILA